MQNKGGAIQKEWWSLGVGMVSSWRDIHNNIFELFWRTKSSTQVEDGNFRLSTRSLEPQPSYLTTIQSEINHPGAPTSYVPMKTSPPKPRVWGFCSWTTSLLAWPCSRFSAPKSQCFSSFGLTVHRACLGQQKEPLDDIEMRSVCVCVCVCEDTIVKRMT